MKQYEEARSSWALETWLQRGSQHISFFLLRPRQCYFRHVFCFFLGARIESSVGLQSNFFIDHSSIKSSPFIKAQSTEERKAERALKSSMVQNSLMLRHLIIHIPISLKVSEQASKQNIECSRARKWSKHCGANEWRSGASEQKNEPASTYMSYIPILGRSEPSCARPRGRAKGYASVRGSKGFRGKI